MAHDEPPHQDPHCLQIQLFSFLVLKELKLIKHRNSKACKKFSIEKAKLARNFPEIIRGAVNVVHGNLVDKIWLFSGKSPGI